MSWRARIAVLALIAPMMAGVAVPAFAEIQVSGKADKLELIAKQSTIKEALQRLASSFALELHDVEDLDDPLTGSFKGPLASVVDQILAGRDHYMRPKGPGMALFVLASKQPKAATDAAAAPATEDPVKEELQKQIVLSPEGQEMAVKMFGEKGRYLQVDETLLQSFYGNRGGRRFIAGAARLPH